VELAREVGSDRTLNMVMIGAVCGKTELLSLEECSKGMEAALKGKNKFFDINRKGIERGFTFVAESK
jgi:2-oxoglutarate ferredoxin oxidoreductase subunit gamma